MSRQRIWYDGEEPAFYEKIDGKTIKLYENKNVKLRNGKWIKIYEYIGTFLSNIDSKNYILSKISQRRASTLEIENTFS